MDKDKERVQKLGELKAAVADVVSSDSSGMTTATLVEFVIGFSGEDIENECLEFGYSSIEEFLFLECRRKIIDYSGGLWFPRAVDQRTYRDENCGTTAGTTFAMDSSHYDRDRCMCFADEDAGCNAHNFGLRKSSHGCGRRSQLKDFSSYSSKSRSKQEDFWAEDSRLNKDGLGPPHHQLRIRDFNEVDAARNESNEDAGLSHWNGISSPNIGFAGITKNIHTRYRPNSALIRVKTAILSRSFLEDKSTHEFEVKLEGFYCSKAEGDKHYFVYELCMYGIDGKSDERGRLERELRRHFLERGNLGLMDTAYFPRIGEHCAVVFSRNNAYCRAELLKYLSEDECVVRLIDYQRECTLETTSLRKLPLRFTSVPAFGSRVYSPLFSVIRGKEVDFLNVFTYVQSELLDSRPARVKIRLNPLTETLEVLEFSTSDIIVPQVFKTVVRFPQCSEDFA